ncbi:hypothetical protein V5O48_002054 [Marasmius crinis-equi]|uniref:RlpA-like double-psi beta-barrel-protein domain-containing protein-containing protein n=1 Tax=Marasmius crinis-equi TaxID=585013 RepID=A0ABR3FWR5_9AGAR
MPSKFMNTLLLTATLLLPLVHTLHVPVRGRSLNPTLDDRDLQKRFDNSRFTFYAPGLGACGGTNSESDFIVALNAPQWDGGSHCGQTITISYNGKSTSAQIVDLCPSCAFGALDLSPSLFSFFASQDLGVIQGSWDFGGNGGGGGQAQEPEPPKTTQEPPKTTQEPPKTTQEPPKTTEQPPPPPPTSTSSTPPPPPPTTSSSSSSSSSRAAPTSSQSSSSSASATKSSTSSSALPTVTVFPDTSVGQLCQGVWNMANLVVAGAEVKDP